jgi:hypothetical protein
VSFETEGSGIGDTAFPLSHSQPFRLKARISRQPSRNWARAPRRDA